MLQPQLIERQLLNRLRTIQQNATQNGWSETLEEEYNDINRQQLDIHKSIEEKIRKLRTGGKPWSPTLQKHRDTIWVLSLLIKKCN